MCAAGIRPTIHHSPRAHTHKTYMTLYVTLFYTYTNRARPRPIGVQDLYRFLLVLADVHVKRMFFIWICMQDGPELVQNIFEANFCLGAIPQGPFSSKAYTPPHPRNVDIVIRKNSCSCLLPFTTWLLYARKICSEILCRRMISKSKYLSPESKSNWKAPNEAPQPKCRPDFPGNADDNHIPQQRQPANNSPISPDP